MTLSRRLKGIDLKRFVFRSAGLRGLTLVMLMSALAGCSLFGDKEDPTAQAESLPPLEVPPDLITPAANSRYLTPPAGKPAGPVATAGGVASPATSPLAVELMRDGEARWLQVSALPEQLWPGIKSFVTERGFTIAQDEPALGFVETQWRDRSETEGLVLPGTRDGLRIRVEPAPVAGHSEIHLTLKSSRQVNGQWVMVDEDNREREIEMLNRLAVSLGGSVPLVQQAPVAAVAAPGGGPAPAVSPLSAPVVLPPPATDMTPAEKAAIDQRFRDIEEECALCRPR